MPTLADLRQALDRLEAEAPDDTRTRTAVLRRTGSDAGSSRRRWSPRSGPLLVAAVAVLVTLATVVVLGIRGEVAQPAAPPPATELIWTFDVPDPPAGATFVRVSISAEQQFGVLVRDEGDYRITVHRPGSFDPNADLQQPEPVTVAGQDGYLGRLTGGPDHISSLAWPTPAGGWAVIDRPATPGSAAALADELRSVAELVGFGRFGSPALPFRLGWLPPGISVQGVAVAVRGGPADAPFGSASFGDGSPASATGTVQVARTDGGPGPFSTEIDDVVGPDRTALTVGGRPAVLGPAVPDGIGLMLNARVLAVDVGDGSVFLVYVANSATDRYPTEFMSRIAEQADVTMPMTDPGTWTLAPEAVAG